MIRRPPRSTRTDTLFPYTTLFRSGPVGPHARHSGRLTTRGASHVARVLPARIAPYAAHMIEKVPPDLSKFLLCPMPGLLVRLDVDAGDHGSEEHTSELQSLMRISYAVFCLKKKNINNNKLNTRHSQYTK